MKRVFIAFMAAVLLLSLSGIAVAAAPPAENPGKGPPDLAKKVFIHYPKDLGAKGGVPGAPTKPPKPDDGGGKLWYKYSGIHWDSLFVDYSVNLTGSGDDGTFLGGIQAGFGAWTGVTGSGFEFLFAGETTVNPDVIDPVEPDYLNVVGWVDLNAEYPNAIAVTMVWYNTQTGLIIDVDMAFNSSSSFAWHQNESDDDWAEGNTAAYDVDVQNIATHEAGHWLMLGDMYNKPAGEQTMFGIGHEFGLQKRTLESGDIAGIGVIYPAG